MNFTNPWDAAFEQSPAGTESISAGDDRIRELKKSIRERCQDGWWDEIEVPIYLDTNLFGITGDKTLRYSPNRALAFNVSTGTVFSSVESTIYNSGLDRTEITIRDEVLDTGLSKVFFGISPYGSPYVEIPEPPPVPLGGSVGGDFLIDPDIIVNQVNLLAGFREVNGKWYHWDEDIMFIIGPSGSNPESDAIAEAALGSICIDTSTLPEDPNEPLAAENFIYKASMPFYYYTKHGWYVDNEDRCIGIVLTDNFELVPQIKTGNRVWYKGTVIPEYNVPHDTIVEMVEVPAHGEAVAVDFMFRCNSSGDTAVYHGVRISLVDETDTIREELANLKIDNVGSMRLAFTMPFYYKHNKLHFDLASGCATSTTFYRVMGYTLAEGF